MPLIYQLIISLAVLAPVSASEDSLIADTSGSLQSAVTGSDSIALQDSVSVIPDSTRESLTKAPDSISVLPGQVKKDSALSIPGKKSLISGENQGPVNHTGLFFGIGAGWTLGSFSLIDLWTKSLPDSLGDFGLNASSFRVEPDTSLPDSLQISDTASLRFAVRNKTDHYTMTFPIKISLTKVRETDLFSTALSFSMINKKFKASVFSLHDSLDNRIDVKQNISIYYLTLEALYGIRFPERYFSIEGVDRSDFIIGIGISPLVSLRSVNKTDRFSDNPQIKSIEKSIKSTFDNYTSYGLAFSFRTGLNTIRSLKKFGAVEVGVTYNFNWYNRFISSGERVRFRDIDPDFKNDRALSSTSNRLEISFSLLRKTGKKAQDK
ncbi:MAG: hypothetical protein GX556_18995 [Fibrobacter sp.]|mgnify:CR=1 FL=1|nr:hypothetical protein [Fibrobacter sp.]